jgi:uncharacterized membrane protein YedE/YeeE
MVPGAEGRRYANPILAGIALGAVLFASFLIAGRGLGASGAFATTAAATVHWVAPARAAAHPYLADWIPEGQAGVLGDWLVLELIGVGVGAWASARLARRVSEPAALPRAKGERRRWIAPVLGGMLMGAGARLAHGCTSGLALSGGALLATGAWLFIPTAFGAAFLTAFLHRRLAVPGAAS